MNAEEALKSGELAVALSDLQQRVKKDPADSKLRVFLFQLLAVLGQWERALTQLRVAGELDAGNLAMVNTYREAVHCEVFRADVFTGKRIPLFFGKPERWIAMLSEALQLSARDRIGPSQTLRAEAFELAPATSGRLNGTAFEWISDADQRLGPVMEAIINGRYYWVPFQHIKTLAIEAPEDLRDLVWAPAHITWANKGETVALIPSRYPGAEAIEGGQLQMARKTDWMECGAGLFLGLGQRMLATDAGEHPFLEIRRLELECDSADSSTE